MTDSSALTTILLIDDNEVNRYTLTKILATKGVSTIQARSGEEGVRMVESLPDLVLLDIHLPDMTGYEALERIRKNPKNASLPIILISATEPAPYARSAAASLGVRSFLTLPVVPEDLWIVVEAVFHRSKQQAS
jgi:CheY-like chemotaxis protein